MGQPDYINKISELASGVGMAVDKVDYTVANKVVDMLYKLTPAGWDTLAVYSRRSLRRSQKMRARLSR